MLLLVFEFSTLLSLLWDLRLSQNPTAVLAYLS